MKNKRIYFLMSCFLLVGILVQNVYADHTHNTSCYGGNAFMHTHVGNSNEFGGCYTVPIHHIHTDDCYDTQCSNERSDYDVSYNSDGTCSECGKITTKFTFTCKNCGVTATYEHVCGNSNCSKYFDVSTIQLNHGTMSLDNAKKYGYLKCGLEENQVVRYDLGCGLEENVYYDQFEKVATPECGTIVTSWKAKQENQNGSSINNKVVLTYLDGHTSTISGLVLSDNLDLTKDYDKYPIDIVFSIKTKAGNSQEDQKVTIYYTHKNEVATLTPGVTTKNDKDKLVSTKVPTKTPTIVKDNKDDKDSISSNNIKEGENGTTISGNDIANEDGVDNIVLSSNKETNAKPNNTNYLAITIIVAIILIGIFVGINIYIKKKE